MALAAILNNEIIGITHFGDIYDAKEDYKNADSFLGLPDRIRPQGWDLKSASEFLKLKIKKEIK